MIRTGILVAACAWPLTAIAQDGPSIAPRAVALFQDASGYEDLPADRFGTPAQPTPTELGVVLMLRMVRNVCLELEQGATLNDVLPDGFAPYPRLPYMLAEPADPDPSEAHSVWSSTGSIDADELDGNPTIWISPAETGMTCQVEWYVPGDIAPDRQLSMATFLNEWLPFELALVRASQPSLSPQTLLFDLMEWDRPCGDHWCPVTVLYRMSDGYIGITTTLNITAIEGTRP